jgi:GNAT superfamily N-acetyltransferase
MRFRDNINAGSAHIFVVTAESGDILGSIAGGPIREPIPGYDAELYALYLLRGHHRAGLGRALVLHLAAELHGQGHHAMTVWALAETPAVAFYKRFGAVPITGKMVEIGGARLPDLALGWPDLRRLPKSATSR